MDLDEKDTEILKEIMIVREQIVLPRIGDYVLFPTGELERFSYYGGDGLQTSPGGSFYLFRNGQASFSGGLNPTTPLDKLTLTDKSLMGTYWFFHHGLAGADRGVYFDISCRVYTTTAEYKGFLSDTFKSPKIEELKISLNI